MSFSRLGERPVKQTIYIDVLVGVNLFINYFLLLCVSKFLSLETRRRRLVAAALLGAAYSLTILLPELSPALSLPLKLLMSLSIVLAAFGYHGIRRLVRATVAFYLTSFAFAGLMLALWYFFAPQGLMIRNSVVYFNISPLALIALTVVCYGCVTLFRRVTGRQMPRELNCRIVIERGGRTCSCAARVDTGNTLREPFSGDPVAVVYEPAIASLIPPKESLNFRLVPFDAVSGNGVLEAFRPDRLTVYSGGKTFETRKVFIAAAKTKLGESDALLNPDLLQKTSG